MTTIERLRALLDGASDPPWQWLDSGGDPGEYDELQDGRGEMVATGFRDYLGDRDGYVALTDGRLCAEARNALPALLDVAEAARFDHSAHRLVDCRGCAALDRLEGTS